MSESDADDPPFPLTSKRRRLPDEGTLDVFVTDEQTEHAVDVEQWVRLAESVLFAEGIRGEAELSVRFVDEATMSDLNVRSMESEGPTDVLAFPLEDDLVGIGRWPDNGTTGPTDPSSRGAAIDMPLLLGDVVICPAVAARNAPEHAGTYDDELALLLVHGILHVLGMDHAFDEEANAMRAKEQDLLARFWKQR